MHRNSFFIFLTALIFIFAFARMKNGILLVDEGNHFNQIIRFAGGDFHLNEILMTVPGYHLVIALLVRITGVSKLADVRLIAFVINLFLIIAHARKSIFFIWGVFLLSFLFLWIGGVVGSGYAKNFVHFSWTLFGNIYFFLFISFVLFLPRQIAALPRIYTFLRGKKWMVAVLFLFYLFFLATFAIDNPFNHTTWFIRNALLEFFTRDIFSKSVFFIFLAYSLLAYIVSPFHFRWGYLIYPFIVLYLLPYWLIETRYYFIPLTLFLLLTKSPNSRVEGVQTFWNILLSVYIFEGIVTLKFFL